MSESIPPGSLSEEENAILLRVLEGTAHQTGEEFFPTLVWNLAKVLGTHGAMVTDFLPESRRLRTRAFWLGDGFVSHYEYDMAGTPCEPVVTEGKLVHFPDRVIDLFPTDPDLEPLGVVSYTGMPFKDRDGQIIGHLAVIDTKPLKGEPRYRAIFEIFGARAAAEMLRLRAEAAVREREERLARLIDGAMDGIIDFDDDLKVRLLNTSAAEMFHVDSERTNRRPLDVFFSEASVKKLRRFLQSFETVPEHQRRTWISGGLQGRRPGDEVFPIEATLSQGVADGRRPFYTLILRDVNDRLEAERRIHELQEETAYLKEELQALQETGEIIGRSKAIEQAMRAVAQVAETDATVLLLGETGTGKELFARAIHRHSRRRDKQLVTLNCAAIPTELVESEFFGHEQGAFTGATSRREGRFARADGGTIFLDEIGELALDLQAKLLRVLQDGEFEPVGSSTPRKVDVRVIAATNRDLADEVQNARFREDLYYRLNVFPIPIPPLRERGGDIVLLAEAFAARFSQRMARTVEPLSAEDARCLEAYPWPGNVRELQNIIERAVITSKNGRLDLRSVLHVAEEASVAPAPGETPEASGVRTVSEMRELERQNLVRALETTGWKVSGARGAAKLLGVKPSTLSARMKALSIQRPPM